VWLAHSTIMMFKMPGFCNQLWYVPAPWCCDMNSVERFEVFMDLLVLEKGLNFCHFLVLVYPVSGSVGTLLSFIGILT